jgi:hypothetical protein
MNNSVSTQADPRLYRCAWRLLWVAYMVPLLFLILDRYLCSSDLFNRSGAIALFLTAIAQYQQLGRLQDKNLQNARRVGEGQAPWPISQGYRRLEIAILLAGIYGTGVWAYGDMLEKFWIACR